MTINVLHQQKSLGSQQTLGINQLFAIDTATAVGGNTVYRKVLFLRLPLDAQAAQLVLKQFALTATFSAFTFSAGASSPLLKPQGWRQKDGKTIIRFARAWPISRINSNSHNAFALYRVDGEAVADEATLVGATNNDLGPGFVSHEFGVELSSISVLQADIALTEKNFAAGTKTRKSSSFSAVNGAVNSAAGSGADGVDKVFDNAAAVNIVGLRSVSIFGMPSTPRVGIVQDALEADVEAGNYTTAKVDWLALNPGEHAANIGAAIAADVLPRIQSVVDEKLAAGAQGNTMILPIVFESDAPCRCTLNQFLVGYALRATLFGDAQTERKLRFSGTTIDGQQVRLKLPAGVIESVSMEINDAAQDQLTVGVSAAAAQRKSIRGAAIDSQQAVAVRVLVPAATLVRGVSLAVNALAPATTIEVSLLEDRNDTPAGAVLAVATGTLDGVGSRQFINVVFETPHAQVVLDQKPYWLLIRAKAGSLLWLAHWGLAGPAAAPPQKVLLLKDLQSGVVNSGTAQTARAIAGIALEYGWILNRRGEGLDIALSIGQQPVPLQGDSVNTRRQFLQLPSALVQPLTETSLDLVVTRASAGVVSLSALQIDYRLHT
jgi:hypothetical protein